MADAATEFLLNNLKELLEYHAHLIKDTRGNIENLQRDLRVFKAFLKDTVKMREDNETIKDMVKEIHDVVYDVEDAIDLFVTKTIDNKSKGVWAKIFKNAASLHSIGKTVEGIKGKVERCRKEIGVVNLHEGDLKAPEPRPPRMKNMVGFKDVTEELIKRLLEEESFDVVSIIGMLGLGKTTVAWKIFNDDRIVYKFPTRIWLTISQKFSEKEVFLNILKEFDTITEDTRRRDALDLANMVSGCLEHRNFLIVMDDVWEPADWKKLEAALPHGNTKGKVLLTSRIEDVGKVACKPRLPYNLRKFEPEESWELLRWEALGTLECPPQLVHKGEIIAENCGGLPLAIIVIGGILATKSLTPEYWETVSKHVSLYLNEKDPENRMRMFISLSYDQLPYHLRACFLYLGLFPEDYEIPLSRLIRMWIGEGFIQQKVDCSLEETAMEYLEDLISRNLVKSVKFKPDGKVKTCQIHDTLGKFCRTEAKNENFLQEIMCNTNGQCIPSDIAPYRRLSIHSNCLDFVSSKPVGPRVRSFVCFTEENYEVSGENGAKFFGAFKLARVLDVIPLKFFKIDSKLYKLVHTRYLALSFKSLIDSLPSYFNDLSNVQTLIIHTDSHTLKVKADIWKMRHLRHFKTNASATLPEARESGNQSAELQTLGLISAESCTEQLSTLAPNLKKLGIRGQLALLLERKIGSFDSLGNMVNLGKLKLVNDASPKPPIEGKLHRLPGKDRFPPNLTSLTLCATFLGWEHMSTLASLEKLKVLKLKDKAFMGDTWDAEQAKDGEFRCLEFLHIEHTDLDLWKASRLNFPNLKVLVLKSCEKLRGIPIELAQVPSFHKLELSTCSRAALSAKYISDAKEKTTPAEGSAFMLSIFPPIG